MSDEVPPGDRRLDYHVRVAGDGTPAQFQEIHETVMRTSPNYFNMAPCRNLTPCVDHRQVITSYIEM